MKPIIGIVSRPVISDEGHIMLGVYKDMYQAIIDSGGIPIGLLPLENSKVELNNLDGLILQGGDRTEEYEIEYLKYAYEYDIPTLGICLGMQTMGEIFNGKLINVVNHKNKKDYVHEVYIDKNSKLYKFLETERFMVNSRHKSAVINTNLNKIGISEDGVIEAIEDPNKKFFIGVQWHPESMFLYDDLSKKLFTNFVNMCRREQ